MLDRVEDTVVTAARRYNGALDTENPDQDLESRAAELAACVDDLEWRNLDEAQRLRWKNAARRVLEA